MRGALRALAIVIALAVSVGALARRRSGGAGVVGRAAIAGRSGALAGGSANRGDALLDRRDDSVGAIDVLVRRFVAAKILSCTG